jgi:hypothetical protein
MALDRPQHGRAGPLRGADPNGDPKAVYSLNAQVTAPLYFEATSVVQKMTCAESLTYVDDGRTLPAAAAFP